MGVLPSIGARDPLPGHIVGKVRGVGRVLKQLTVAETRAVDPGDGEVQVPLSGEVAEEERGGQQLRVGFAVVRIRDLGVKNVADQIQHDGEVRKPAEHDYDPVVSSVSAGVREDLGLIVDLRSRVRGDRRTHRHGADKCAHSTAGRPAAGKAHGGGGGEEEGSGDRPMRHPFSDS